MGKSGNHKAENTFRFQTFSERIKNINIDVIHQIRHHDDTPEETGTYFAQALQKQTELNCTDHFTDFKREVSLQVQTFTQLVHHEDNIVAALKKHLLVPGSMALPSLLDLLVQLARDLQTDFYRHFQEFFHILVQLLNTYTHDVEILESTFSCLSYIFKFLWRYLLKDVELVYGYFSALLGKQYKEYVRNFAAESFAFLMRKSKDHSGLFDFMFKSLRNDPDKCQGVGRLMFEMMKGVKEQFHSCISKVFPLLLEKLGPQEKQSSDMLPWQQVEDSLATTVLSMAFHSDKDHLSEIWQMMLTAISSTYTRWEGYKKTGREGISDMLGRLLRLLQILINFKYGKMISKPDNIAKVLLDLLRGASLPDEIGQEVMNVTAALLNKAHNKMEVEVSSRLVPAVFKTLYPAQMAYTFTRQLFELPLFEKDVLPSLLKFCAACTSEGDTGAGQGRLALITDLVLYKCPPPATGEDLEQLDTYMLDFGTGSSKRSFPLYVTSLLEKVDSLESSENQSKLWSALVCLPHVRPLPNKKAVIHRLSLLITKLLQQNPMEDSLAFICCQAAVTMIMMSDKEIFENIPLNVITGCLSANVNNVHILRLADLYFTRAVNEHVEDVVTLDTLLTIFPALQNNLSSPFSLVRLLTLRILDNFDLPLPVSEVEHPSVFRICLRAETTAATVQTYRERQRHLQMLEFTAVQNCLPTGPFSQIPLRYLLGSLFVNFKLLWEPIRTIILSHALSMDREAFWDILGSHLQLAAEKSEHQLLGTEEALVPSVADDTDTETSSVQRTFNVLFNKMGLDSSASPDYSNFRVQLWQTMHQFPEKCSPKSRLLVPLLFRFMKNEYYLADLSVAPTQDVRRKTAPQNVEEGMDTSEISDTRVMSPDKNKSDTVMSPGKDNSGKLGKRTRKYTENDTSDDSDDDEEKERKPVTRKSARISRNSESKGENEDTEVQFGRNRTRSQCSDYSNEEVPIGTTRVRHTPGRIRTRSQTDGENEEPKGRITRSKGGAKGENKIHIEKIDGTFESPVKKRTRNAPESESDMDLSDNSQALSTESDSRRRTRSSVRASETSVHSDEETESSESENEEDSDSDTQGQTRSKTDRDTKMNGKTKTKRLSAIVENENDIGDELKTTKGLERGKGKTGQVDKDLSKGKEVKGANKKRHAATSSLVVQLELFAKFKDPLCMYMETDLRKLYFDLLIHKNGDVQRTAFQCIMTYKYKYLVPYRENFNRLLDDKTFKTEIVLFSIDHETSTINTDHRPDVLPVLMRILFGKMHAKTGKDTAGKKNSGVRQSIVFRFLNGCRHDELKIFIDLVFAPFQQLVSENPLKMVKSIKADTDLSCVLPVKKMQGALNSIDMIFKKLGHHLDMFLPNVIQIVIGMATLCGVLLGNRDRLVPHVLSQLKSIRQSTVYRIIQLFSEYDKYLWRPVEIDAVFEATVWPQLDKLSYEGLYHPTPLLKLLQCWTKNPRYFSLLAKHQKDDVSCSPLPHIIKLLLHKDVSSQVTTCIMEMIDNLLSDTEYDQEIKVVEVNDMLKLSTAEHLKDMGVGVKLLLPHVGDLLTHIQKYVLTLSVQLKGKKHNASGKELNILSRLSSFVSDEEMSKTLVGLLIPFLNPKFKRSLKTEEDILTSILHLLKQISDRSSFFNHVSRLFATLEQRASRLVLADIFAVVCEGLEDLEALGTVVQKVNSFDKTRVEEPDYLLRLEGYRSATSLVHEMVTIDTRVCLTLIHNCSFFISTVDDMSLRDNSTMCIMNIVKRCGELGYDEKTYNTLILSGLMPELRNGLKSKKQTVLQEFVTILSVLVDTYGDQSAFEDLKPLRDKDLEADFFENLKHIQIYKRSRALRRLIKYLDTNIVKKETINAIFLPLVSSFLMDETYKKHATVQDAAIDAMGVICKVLPWKLYLNQLKHYLKLLPQKLDKQKLLVRVLVSVMDNFHFDLSNSTLNVKNTPLPKVERAPEPEEIKQPSVVIASEAEMIQGEEDTENKTENDNVEMVPEINEAGEETPITEELTRKRQLCSATLATKIHETVLKNLISQLHKVLVQKARSDGEHKVVKSKFPEDEEILRVPIALAMVKLLQNLPKGALERFLPGILLKVCNFLKSRSSDIRNTSRETLVKIQSTLGPRFFPFILSELRGSLRRGYQRHVLCYTVYKLLKNMETCVRPGDIDVCLKSLQQVFNDEIFGDVSEEKEVEGIKSKVFEARSSKSYDSYEFIAKYICTRSLVKLMEPLKLVLDTTRSHKSANKVQEVLRKVCIGLLENQNIPIETLLVFVHTQTSQTLPLIGENASGVQPKKVEEKPGQKPKSCLLLPQAAPRGGLKPKTSKKTNKHVLVEFGLQLLGMCLKKQKVVATETTHIRMLDPLVPMFAECLTSKYVMINANCLRVLCYLFKFPLPSLKTHITDIASNIFVLLRKYATAGAARGDNKELVSMLFKAVTVLVRDAKFHEIDKNQLQVLLTFCEEDLHDYNRQSTAFTLLKAILSRKLDIPEIHELMKKIREMSISAESPHVQRECRQSMVQYLLDYPLGKKLQDHLQFYVSQLEYELESGRESALEMLAAFFTAFPQTTLSEYAGLFFLPMAASLANDESNKCRKLIALAIKSLLSKLDHNSRSNLYCIALKWFMDIKLKIRRLAAQLCGLFVEVEGGQFELRLKDTLPVIEQQLEPGKYKQVELESLEHDQDLMIFTMLNTLLKILRECAHVITDSKWEEHMNIIWEYTDSYLSYPHLWVQLASSQLFGLLFAAWQPDQLITMETTSSKTQYLAVDTHKKLKSLSIDFVSQLQSELLNDDLANQVIKNMIFITKCAKLMDLQPVTVTKAQTTAAAGDDDDENTDVNAVDVNRGRYFSVLWLVRKMVREAHYEAINNNKVTIKRVHVFKWLAAVSLDLGVDMDPAVLRAMIPPLQRELNDQSSIQDANVRSLAGEVVELLKKTVGLEKFTESYASTQKIRAERKDKRKQQKAFQAVSNPEIAAKRKLKKNLAKIAAKKRKIEHIKPSKKAKKRKYEAIVVTD